MRLPTPAIPVAAAIAAILVLLAFAVPQLDRPFWHDEVATLELFASSGPLYPFTDYHLPNNHMLSSAVLALMRTLSDAPSWLRLWPLASSLCACLLVVRLAWRLGGGLAAWLAGMAFACSGITQAFALQLRGYAPSWPCLLLATLAVAAYAQGRWRTLPAMLVFALASLLAMALLPTNLPWLLVLAAIAALLGPAGDGSAGRWWTRLSWLALPAVGLLPYAAVFAQLIGASGQSWFNTATRLGTLAEIYGDMAQDVVLLLPLALVGLILYWRSAVEARQRIHRLHAVVLLLVLLVPLPLWLLVPAPPFSRAVVPWWPQMIVALALVAATALRTLENHKRAVMLVLALAMIANATARETMGWRPWPPVQAREAMPQTLLLHYYRAGYRPDLAVAVIVDWLHDPRALVWSDYSDFPSLRWHLLRRNPGLVSRLNFAPDTEPALLRAQFAHRPLLLVAASEQQACAMLAQVDVACRGRFLKVADSGFFKVFRVRAEVR